jgi:hypothetical protein
VPQGGGREGEGVTREGTRRNVRVLVEYLDGWLAGWGCALTPPIPTPQSIKAKASWGIVMSHYIFVNAKGDVCESSAFPVFYCQSL